MHGSKNAEASNVIVTMKPSLFSLRGFGLAMAALLASLTTDAQTQLGASKTSTDWANCSTPIPISQLSAVAGKQYQGDGLSVSAAPDGARLRCAFQRLEGRVTPEGLWLSSNTPGVAVKLRVVAAAVGREVLECGSPLPLSLPADPFQSGRGLRQSTTLSHWGGLVASGTVSMADKLVRFTRPGVTEEYSVSMEGVRQDFVITERPAGVGDLHVGLALSGARAEPAAYGAKLTLEGSRRALAYIGCGWRMPRGRN